MTNAAIVKLVVIVCTPTRVYLTPYIERILFLNQDWLVIVVTTMFAILIGVF